MENVIEVHHLSKRFGEAAAVDDLSLSVRAGEIFGVIGPDGAGKTTSLRMLGGIMLPSGGTARVLGYALPQEAEAEKEHIGYMSQKFNLYPDLTVQENLHFFSDLFRIPRAILQERLGPLMEMTRLAPFAQRLAGNLSGGMKQKLALMCTLIHRPRLLLLDEPTTGVDPVSRREFWEILHEILREGVTIVISTPYMDEAEWCTRVGLMFRGKLVAQDTPKNLKSRLKGVVAEVTPRISAGELKALLARIPGVKDSQVFGGKYHVILEDAESLEKAERALGAAAEVRAIAPSIEDVFVSMIE